MGIYRGISFAGCEPDKVGIGPSYANSKLLKQNGLSMDDFSLWELKEKEGVENM